MRYIKTWEYSVFITIGEYTRENQPEVYKRFKTSKRKDVTKKILSSDDVNIYIRNIMTERPKGGRGGLLPGEVDL